MFKKYKLKDYNFRLVFEVLLLNIFSVVVVTSANPSYHNKQVFGVILGVFVMAFFSLLDYEFILKFNWLIYFGTIGMLGMILLPIFHFPCLQNHVR